MELITVKSPLLRNDNDKILWQFFRDVHFRYLIMHPLKLNKMLNEYLLIMNIKYNLHKDRFKIFSQSQDPNISYSDDHLTSFQRVISHQYNYEEYIFNDDFLEMILFYTELMNYISDTLQERFIYGKEFDKTEIEKLINQSSQHNFRGHCSQTEIMVRIPKAVFGLDGYKDLNSFKGNVLYFGDDNFIEIYFDNSNKTFVHKDLWDIKASIIKPINCYVMWETLTDEKVYLYFSD